MTRDLIIGVEVAPDGAVAVAYDRGGRDVASASVDTPMGRGDTTPMGADPASAQASAVRLLGDRVPGLAGRAAALAFTYGLAQGGSRFDRVPSAELSATPEALDQREAAAAGLDEAIPVFTAPPAHLSAAIAAGLLDGAGAGCSVLGWGDAHLHATGANEATAFGGTHAPSGALGCCWLVDVARDVLAGFGFDPSQQALMSSFDADVLAAPPGSLLFQPESASDTGLFDERRSPRAHIFGLSTRHGFGDLLRAAIESFAFAARAAYETARPEQIRVAGENADAAALRTIVASACRAPVRMLARDRAATAGAALVAAVAIGQEAGHAAAAARWVTPFLGTVTPPDAALAAVYDRLYPLVLDAGRATLPVRSGLDALVGPTSLSAIPHHGAAPTARA